MSAGTSTVGLFLDNEFRRPSDHDQLPVLDPADGSEVGRVIRATPDDAKAAMESAGAAQPAWEALGGAARARILRRTAEILRSEAEELARLVTREMGKVLFESRGETAGAIENLEYYADYGRTLSGEDVALLPRGQSLRLQWVPRGVVVGITPWNFPAATVTRKIAPALIGGNTMVVKPASTTPLTTLRIADAFRRAGLPKGVLNVVTGSGAQLGAALVQHPLCSTVTMTGSTKTGTEMMRLAAPGIVKCLLELGGKAPLIVCADADLDWAVRAAVWARFWNAGQACIANERTYVDRSIAPRFLERLTALTRQLTVGRGLDPGVDVGPLYAPQAAADIAARVDEGVRDGGQLLLGGTRPKDGPLARGAFYPPTILTGVEDSNPLVREEIFGPVLPVLSFSDVEEVIARSNRSPYGLSSYVFTRDLATAERMQRELRFGETYVNRVGPESPQGFHTGFRTSGLGGEGSRHGVTDYLQLKSNYVDWQEPHSADYFLPYPR